MPETLLDDVPRKNAVLRRVSMHEQPQRIERGEPNRPISVDVALWAVALMGYNVSGLTGSSKASALPGDEGLRDR